MAAMCNQRFVMDFRCTEECNQEKTIAAALAVATTLGVGVALAQLGPHVGDGANSVTPQYQYSLGNGSAKVGDGASPGYLRTQKLLADEPGYSVGTGSAAKRAIKTYNQNATTQNTTK